MDTNNNNSNGNNPFFPMNVGHPQNVSALAASSLQILYPIAVVLILFRTPPPHPPTHPNMISTFEKKSLSQKRTPPVLQKSQRPVWNQKGATKKVQNTAIHGQQDKSGEKEHLSHFPFSNVFFFFLFSNQIIIFKCT